MGIFGNWFDLNGDGELDTFEKAAEMGFVEENGVYVDEVYGNELLKLAINSVLLDVEKQLDSHYGY